MNEDRIEIAVAHLLTISKLISGPFYMDRIGCRRWQEGDEDLTIIVNKKVGKRKQKVTTADRYRMFDFTGCPAGHLASCKELEGYEAEWTLDENVWTLTLFGGKLLQLEGVANYFGLDFSVAQSIFTRAGYGKLEIYAWDVAAKLTMLMPRKVEAKLADAYRVSR